MIGAPHVDLHDQVEPAQGDVQVADGGDGGIVDQDVQPAEVVERWRRPWPPPRRRRPDWSGTARARRPAASTRATVSSMRARGALGLVAGRPGRGGDVAAGLGQRHRGGRPDAAAGPGHQGHLPIEIDHDLPSPRPGRLVQRRVQTVCMLDTR